MKKLTNSIWSYRKHLLISEHGGYTVHGSELICLNVYKTLRDAKEAINKVMDGTNKLEPRIIGVLYYDDNLKDMVMSQYEKK